MIDQCDYSDYTPQGKLIYCDPPYQNTTGYRGDNGKRNEFDHEKFWNTIREWSKTNWVFVSEYNAPSDFVCVNKYEMKSNLRSKAM